MFCNVSSPCWNTIDIFVVSFTKVKDRLWRNPKNSEENVRKHLSQYFAYVEELGDYYVDGQHINADQDPHTVFEGLESMICKPLPKNFTS